MTEVRIVRHSKSDYPNDALTFDGFNFAREHASRFSDYDLAISSSKLRAQQTISAIGYPKHKINSEFNELEIKSIKANSAHEYVIQAHNAYPSLVRETSNVLLSALAKLSNYEDKKILVVSHNLALSSLMLALTGQIESFEFLHGLNVLVNENGVTGLISVFKL